MTKTAILVDGGFFRKRASKLWRHATAHERAKQLEEYCWMHLEDKDKGADSGRELYRIFYYDCPPIAKKVYHPLLKKDVDLAETEVYKWSTDFYNELKKKRKFALRLGEISANDVCYRLSNKMVNALLSGAKELKDVTEKDFVFVAPQKGVDMKIGIDIASMVFKKQVSQIILISGDSDFVPAAKMARREGIDFLLDSMGSRVKDNLFEHIDGFKSHYKDKYYFTDK